MRPLIISTCGQLTYTLYMYLIRFLANFAVFYVSLNFAEED